MTESNYIPRIASDSIALGGVIGRGIYGCIYQGKLQGVAVAIKQVPIADHFFEHGAKRIEIFGAPSKLQFPIVMPLAENGDLQHYLRSGNLVGNWKKKARICSDIARAVDFVHAQRQLDKFLTTKVKRL
ncbi:hypothetical protein BC937DRAFT_89694 [Endogone sp. FLAS-F59071]|nr:hypothetical protein BC937DRAFT_89694 [Endogone sp. FLAS-F59071]|eukprot:RUS17638.1 hypothetical protein BC937DRAFT_89694 [Endogone sp. FLAS-F59071]